MTPINQINNNIKIIGRTKINDDLYRMQKSSANENMIEQIANDFIIRNNVQRLPIDVVEITKNNEWILIPFKNAPNFIYQRYSDLLYTDWGFTILYNNQFYIFFDDKTKLEIQRFTIAHEIGHIVLEHFGEANFCVKERDANIFASCLLMPRAILKECNLTSIEGVCAFCGVSYSAASYKLMIISSSVEHSYNELEIRIVKQFDCFIANHYR